MTTQLTNFEYWQQEMYGEILPEPQITPDGSLIETGEDDMRRLEEWRNLITANQIDEQ